MKLKTVYMMGATLLILLAVYGGLLFGGRLAERRPSTGEIGVDTSLLARSEAITFTPAAGKGYELKREGRIWTVDGKPADGAAVGKLLKALAGMRAELLVSTGTADLSGYGLGKPPELSIKASAGKQRQTLIIGRSGAPAGKFYLLGKDGSSVYLMRGSLAGYLGRQAKDWLRKEKKAALPGGALGPGSMPALPGGAKGSTGRAVTPAR